jgi:hypothetical protein
MESILDILRANSKDERRFTRSFQPAFGRVAALPHHCPKSSHCEAGGRGNLPPTVMLSAAQWTRSIWLRNGMRATILPQTRIHTD